MTTTVKNAAKSSIKPVGQLDASMLLARKGEAAPAVRATSQNNPELAWSLSSGSSMAQSAPPQAAAQAMAQDTAQDMHPTPQRMVQDHAPVEPRSPHRSKPTASARLRPESFRVTSRTERAGAPGKDKEQSPVALTLRVDEDAYLRLAYLAQSTGYSLSRVLQNAVDNHLLQCRVPKAGKLTVRPK